MDHPLETKGKPGPPTAAKAGTQTLQMFQSLPKQFFGQRRFALPVGVGKGIALGRGGAANRRQRTGMQLQSIADIVQSQAMCQLRIEQRDDVTPRFKGSRLLLHLCLPGQLRYQMIRNPVANLAQNRQLTPRWLLALLFLFHDRACRTVAAESQRFFSSRTTHAVGRLWIKIDPDTGEQTLLATFTTATTNGIHYGGVHDIALSPNGELIVLQHNQTISKVNLLTGAKTDLTSEGLLGTHALDTFLAGLAVAP